MEFPAEQVTTIKVPRGYSYATVHIPPTSPSKPYLLFLHGFPESAYDWVYQIPFFRSRGYGIIAPDLLGYGASSKPDSPAEYRIKLMASDVASILDHLAIPTVVAVAHDWGCGLLAALAAWHPTRIALYAFLAVGFNPVGRFDVAAVNALTAQHLGYEAFGYYAFLAEPDSPALLDARPDSANALFFADADPAHWRTNVCPPGAARAWLEAGRVVELPAWLRANGVDATRQAILRKGGYRGPTNWYRQALAAENDEDAATVPEERRRGIADKPVLFLLDKKPTGALPSEMMAQSTRQACRDVTVTEIDGGHFFMLEVPDAVNEALAEFITAKGY